jgi:hypothetical protein
MFPCFLILSHFLYYFLRGNNLESRCIVEGARFLWGPTPPNDSHWFSGTCEAMSAKHDLGSDESKDGTAVKKRRTVGFAEDTVETRETTVAVGSDGTAAIPVTQPAVVRTSSGPDPTNGVTHTDEPKPAVRTVASLIHDVEKCIVFARFFFPSFRSSPNLQLVVTW